MTGPAGLPRSDADVLVSEVGPREGLQMTDAIMPLVAKHAWIAALADAGLREIEVGSCVSPRRLPQMADTDAVAMQAVTISGLTVIVLVPNLKGAERAFAAKVHKVTVPVSASREHSQRNVGMTPEAMLDQVAAIAAARDRLADNYRPGVEVGISTAFGCTIEGAVDEARVQRLAEMAVAAGADSVGLSDTVGAANPTQVRRMFKALRDNLGDKAGGAHFHNTRGQGLANVVAALDVGVRTFDASHAGLGGCPYAPGATGNIVTEDLVFMLEAMGLRTGIDLDRLIAARQIIRQALPDAPLHGHVAEAGVPKSYAPSLSGAT